MENSAERAYRNGWRASERTGGATGRDGRSPMERADDRDAPAEWYQGYLDHAAGREYGHTLTCPDHDSGACQGN